MIPVAISMVSLGLAQSRPGVGKGVLPPVLTSPASEQMHDAEFRSKRAASEAIEPTPVPRRETGLSLTDLSTFLVSGDHHLILPKGSVLFCPDPLVSKVSSSPVGQAQPWQEFLAENRSWVTTFEVTLPQIHGAEQLTDSQRRTLSQSGSIVIATLRGQPVTVLASKF